MFPIWITLFFAAAVMVYTAVDTPAKQVAATTITGDVSTTNFLAYRRAVQGYLQANPSATGTIADADLAGYWLPGYIRNPNWTNVIVGSTLYIYSTAAVAPVTLETLWGKSSDNSLIGTKNPANGRLRSYNGFDTGITLPASIPNNAIVMIGR